MIIRLLLSLIFFINLKTQAAIYEPHFDDSVYFDTNIPEYETFLKPTDYVAFSEHGNQDSKNQESDFWDSEAMYNTDKFEGDIANLNLNASTVNLFLNGGPIGSLGEDKQLNAIRDRRQLWKDGRIPYAISSQYSSYSRSVIASAMSEYTANTCIQWSPRTTADKDYVYILPDRGCYSMVGKTGGRQTLSLGNGCIQKGIIIHEMMHAVGFFHEQSRTDRDNYITIMWANIQPGMQGQFEKYSPVTIQTLGSDYDFASIMHYGPKAFSRNGMPTIVPKKKAQIGQRSGFSQVDSYKINTLYECPSGNNKPVPTLPPQPAPVVSVIVPTTPGPLIIATHAPLTVPTERPEVVTSNSIIIQPEILLPVPAENCTNSRPDCDSLASQGWCIRNPHYMRSFCPVSCNMCEKAIKSTNGSCEDLRVDCPELVRRRYCITAQKFSRNFCAKSCGFCFSPPVTETPDLTNTMTVEHITASSTVSPSSKQPLVTFWPIVRPEDRLDLITTTVPSLSSKAGGCRDRKHFCSHWKNAGFCTGVFSKYMTLNCPASCNQC